MMGGAYGVIGPILSGVISEAYSPSQGRPHATATTFLFASTLALSVAAIVRFRMADDCRDLGSLNRISESEPLGSPILPTTRRLRRCYWSPP